jgi:hypothetical protein
MAAISSLRKMQTSAAKAALICCVYGTAGSRALTGGSEFRQAVNLADFGAMRVAREALDVHGSS